MPNAKDVADAVVRLALSMDRPISNVVLLKILFFIQHDYMQEHDEPLFDDDFEAWRFGPVIPSVYRIYSLCGGLPIELSYIENNSSVGSMDDLTLQVKIAVVKYAKKYIDMEPIQLNEMTYAEGSVFNTVYLDGLGEGKIIPKNLIKSSS